MTFRTADELFGDNGPNGPMVPVDTNNPAGYGANNRGVGFGEQLSSAVSNRPHYALAENDDDLNSRVALFEVGGLDACYRLGVAAVPGGGRTINLDGGAVETQSGFSTTLGDTTHFRANAGADTTAGSVGFEAYSRRVGASGLTGNDAPIGFVDFRVLTYAAGNTVIYSSESVTLNPSALGAARVRLNTAGRKFHTSAVSSLVMNGDYLRISGSGSYDGLYRINTLVGGTNTDINVVGMNGSAPSFAANTAATIEVLRPVFGSFGRANVAGVKIIGISSSGVALTVTKGDASSALSVVGPTTMAGDLDVLQQASLTGGVYVEGGVTVNDGGVTLTTDDLTVTAGDIDVTAGNITLGAGRVMAPAGVGLGVSNSRIDSGGNIVLATTKRVTWTTPQIQFKNVNLAKGRPIVSGSNDWAYGTVGALLTTGADWEVSASGKVLVLPIELPAGCAVSYVAVAINSAGPSTSVALSLVEDDLVTNAWSVPRSVVASATVLTSETGNLTKVLTPGSPLTINPQFNYSLILVTTGVAPVRLTQVLCGITVSTMEPCP